jgi:hypothetical protein
MPISKWPKKTFSKNFQNTKKEIYTLENKMEIITKCNTFISKTQKTKTSSIQNVKNDIMKFIKNLKHFFQKMKFTNWQLIVN